MLLPFPILFFVMGYWPYIVNIHKLTNKFLNSLWEQRRDKEKEIINQRKEKLSMLMTTVS